MYIVISNTCHNLYLQFSEVREELLKFQIFRTVREREKGNTENITDIVNDFQHFYS